MFDIGFFELALIGVVLLVVMGPEKLPEVARQGVFMVRKLRTWLTNMKSEMDMQDSEGLSSLREATREIAELKASIAQMGQDVVAEVEEVGNEVQDTVAAVDEDLSDLDPESYFNKLVNDDVEPSLLDDEVAGKPTEPAKSAKNADELKTESDVNTQSSTAKTNKTNKKTAASQDKA